MADTLPPTKRSIATKFAETFAAIPLGVRGQDSFYIHFAVTIAVIAAGVFFQVSRVEWCLLTICITIVLTAEMFNSALEYLAKAIDADFNPHLRDGLNIASAAVMIAACGAATAGLLIFVYHLGALLAWWS